MVSKELLSPSRSASLPAKRVRTSSTSPQRIAPMAADRFQALVMDAILECKRDMMELNKRCIELMEDNKRLREENLALMRRIDSLLTASPSSVPIVSSLNSSSVPHPVSSSDSDSDSVVIIGVPEHHSANSIDSVQNDFYCVNQLLAFLGLECLPTTVYRMGRSIPNKNRLLKYLAYFWFPKGMYQACPSITSFSS